MNLSILPLHLSMLNGGRQVRRLLKGLKAKPAPSSCFPRWIGWTRDILLSDTHTKPPVRPDYLDYTCSFLTLRSNTVKEKHLLNLRGFIMYFTPYVCMKYQLHTVAAMYVALMMKIICIKIHQHA